MKVSTMDTYKNLDMTKDNALKILKEFNTPNHVIDHCKQVSRVAEEIAKAFKDRNLSIDVDLVSFSALLHDIARTYESHEKVGAKYLETLGYVEAAKLISWHTHFDGFKYVKSISEIKEIHIICLADRLVVENRYVGLQERMSYIKHKAISMGYESHIERIEKSEKNLEIFIDKIEKFLGKTIDDIVEGN